MKGMDVAAHWKRISRGLEKYKYVLLVLLAGVILLLIPTGKTQTPPAKDTKTNAGAMAPDALVFDLEQLEEKLAESLSRVDGAGEVSVVLTLKSGMRQILAQDIASSQREGALDEERSTVVVSQGSGWQGPITLQQIYPQFQGALVVCSGGGDPAVQLKLVEAVSALTGLGADKISICKGT